MAGFYGAPALLCSVSAQWVQMTLIVNLFFICHWSLYYARHFCRYGKVFCVFDKGSVGCSTHISTSSVRICGSKLAYLQAA